MLSRQTSRNRNKTISIKPKRTQTNTDTDSKSLRKPSNTKIILCVTIIIVILCIYVLINPSNPSSPGSNNNLSSASTITSNTKSNIANLLHLNQGPIKGSEYQSSYKEYQEGQESIYISIATLGDHACPITINDIFNKAKYPHNLYVGIYQQNQDGDPDCLAMLNQCNSDSPQQILHDELGLIFILLYFEVQ